MVCRQVVVRNRLRSVLALRAGKNEEEDGKGAVNFSAHKVSVRKEPLVSVGIADYRRWRVLVENLA